jgi:hypothetical protein
MTHVLEFVEHTASDLRGGRHSWRVLSLLWTVALSVTVAARLLVL